jgi:hypothetical protein
MYEKRERALDAKITVTFGDCIIENPSANKHNFYEDKAS